MSADDLNARLSGTWVIQRVEQQDAAGNWVAQETPKIGMLVYGIVGPLGSAAASLEPSAPPPVGMVPSDELASEMLDESGVVMLMDDGRLRLFWVKGAEVR